jgi:predicted Zn-dependent peptidase
MEYYVNVGSRHEEKGKTGLAHLFEHLLFRGTPRFPAGQFDRILESRGMRNGNATTSNDFTNYHSSHPIQSFEDFVDMEADRLANLTLTEEIFRTERDVVHNERKVSYENNPVRKLNLDFLSQTFKGTPYEVFPIGKPQDLDSMNVQDAIDFYKRHYQPSEITVTLAGDLSEKRVEDAFLKYYGPLQSNPQPKKEGSYHQRIKGPVFRRIPIEAQNDIGLISYRSQSAIGPDTEILRMASAILGGSASSRVDQNIVQKGLAIGIGSSVLDFQKHPILMITLQPNQNGDLGNVMRMVDHEIQKLIKNGPTQKELDRSVAESEAEQYHGLQTNFGLVRVIGEAIAQFGSLQEFDRMMKTRTSTTRKQVQEVLKKIIRPENRTVYFGVAKKRNPKK